MANIVVIDDAQDICDVVQKALEKDGHSVTCFQNGKDIIPSVIENTDLILLDIMMPEEDGFAICRRIRPIIDCPILFLSAKEEEESIMEGLASGGDDYLVKPFRVGELRARVNAHLRRENRVASHRFVRGEIQFDLSQQQVYVNQQLCPLTKKETKLCFILAKQAGQVFTREDLVELAFGYDYDKEETAITEHIKNIRNKFAKYQLAPIETVWGVGYKWNIEKSSH